MGEKEGGTRGSEESNVNCRFDSNEHARRACGEAKVGGGNKREEGEGRDKGRDG